MLTGRDSEIARVRGALAHGRSAAVLGPVGIGKTALATAVAASLDRARFTVIRLVATEASRSIPFGALAELTMSDDGPSDPAFMMGRVAREVTRRAGRRAAVLVVDDAHLLDGPSAGALLGLAAGRHARVLATIRTGDPPPDAVRALWKDHGAERIDLAPFGRDGTEQLLINLLGGEIAGPTADLLHQWTGGNPLFLTELVRAGRSNGDLRTEAGMWWWRADITVPAGLAELLDHRVDVLGSNERDALAAVALGEPLAIEILDALASPAVAARLEDLALIRTEDTAGGVKARLDHPLLSASVRRQLSPARRRRVAARLLAAAREGKTMLADPVARAIWQFEAHVEVDVDLLLGAAETIMHTDPALAARLAQRAISERWSVRAATTIADAHVEMGEAAQARTVLEEARSSVRTPAETTELAVALAAHRAWAERDPHSAHAELTALFTEATDAESRAETESVDALVLLFAGRTTEALERAKQVIAGNVTCRAVIRARLVEASGYTLVGQTVRALASAEALVSAPPSDLEGLPYARGMGLAALALAQLWRTPLGEVPTTDPAHGRWPTSQTADTLGLEPTAWPLFDGYVARIMGDTDTAIRRLREALVQQSGGEGLFRSEAAGWLVLSLAEAGRLDEAAAVLDREAPDDVAIVPGLLPWAHAGLAAARGQRTTAAAYMHDAIRAARDAGCWLVELGYLTYLASEVLDPEDPQMITLAARIAEAITHVDAPRLVASGEATLEIISPSGPGLLEHAKRLRTFGLGLASVRLADAAGRAGGVNPAVRAEASLLAATLREELGLAAPEDSSVALTRREAEVAALARGGMSDREIADHLGLSVRTVETHLARVYRKLGIASRRELTAS